MPASTAPAEKAVLSALQINNPFERPPVVKAQNIWGESFPDVPEVNATASNSLFDALQKVRRADSSLEKVTSMVFTAEKGVGKSHVIRRIRKRLQASGEGVFIYASVDRYGNLDLVNTLFRQSVAESLEQMGSEGVTQWQEIATLMVAEALRANRAGAVVPAAPELVKKFDTAYHNNRAKGKDLVSDLTKVIRKLKPHLDPYLLRAIIWTLSEERGTFAVKWLAGEALETQDAHDLRLPANQKSEGEMNADALTMSAELLSLVGEYKSVVVCFDELDTLATDSNGYPTSFIILDLIKRLFDSVQQSDRAAGIVILSVLIPNLWSQAAQMGIASPDKISTYGKPIALEYLTAETTKTLGALILEQFCQKQTLALPTPWFPLSEEEVTEFGNLRPYPREALKWFAKSINDKVKLALPVDEVVPFNERFERAYQSALLQFEPQDLDNNDAIAAALQFCFQKIVEIDKIKDQPIEGVVVKSLADVTPRGKNNGWLQFKIIGEEANERVTIGVCVLQQANGLSVGAGFKRLLDTQTFGFSRGCLVRSKSRRFKRNWDSYEYYQQLVNKGGEWVDLVEDEIKPLLALQYIYEHHERFDLSIKRLNSLARTRNLLQQSPLIREILSRPAGVISEEAVEGEALQHFNVAEDSSDDYLAEALSGEMVSPEETTPSADLSADLSDIQELAAIS
jgi:hypothetical protein